MDTPAGARSTIVVGIDGSPSSDRALDWAADQAAVERSGITLVHARVPVLSLWLDPTIVDVDRLRSKITEHGEGLLDAAAARVAQSHTEVSVDRVLSSEDPRETLLELAEGAAMVVIGSRGHGPVRSLLLGSVSVAVSRHAPCPVVVVHPEGETAPADGILVGIDPTPASGPALEFAFRLASTRSLPLTILDCFATTPHGPGTPGSVVRGEEAGDEERRLVETMVERVAAAFPDVRAEVVFDRGFIDRRLIDLSPDMAVTVVSSQPETALQRVVYGSVAPAVVEGATGVVVVVPFLDHA